MSESDRASRPSACTRFTCCNRPGALSQSCQLRPLASCNGKTPPLTRTEKLPGQTLAIISRAKFTRAGEYGYYAAVESVYQIDSFPQDGGLWRVDLFGEVNRNDPVPSDPLVEVLVSPVIADKARVHGIASNLAVDSTRRRSVWINAGYLPLVRIGSVWRNGVRLDSFGSGGIDEMCFPGLRISRATARIVPADLRLDKSSGEYLIPKSAYHLGGRGLRIRLLSVDYRGIAHHVLIPVIELGRFYYFCSSQLTKHLLWGLIDDNGGDVFSRELSHLPVNGVGRVHLRMHIPDNDAWVVSRFAHSPLALARARSIHDSLVVKKANGEPLIPDILPPFEGTTNLIANGKWFESGDRGRFLVFWIKSCSHPFPATHLIHSRDLDGRSDGVEDPARSEVGISRPARNASAADKAKKVDRLRGDTEPRRDLARLESLLHEVRFTDLAKKTRNKIEGRECHFRAAEQSKLQAVATDGWSSGDGISESSARPITLNVCVDDANGGQQERARALPYPRSIEAIVESVKHLAGLGDISYRFVHVMGEAGHSHATLFPRFCDENPRWPYVDGRRRQALVVEIAHADGYHYLFEAEHRKTDSFTTLYARDRISRPLSDAALADILQACARNKGKWLEENEGPHLYWRKLKHTWTSPVAFARTVLGLMMGGVLRPNEGAKQSALGMA